MKASTKGKRKTARQKLEISHPSHGVIFPIPPSMQRSPGPATMIVPRPLDVEAAMRLPRKGRLITLGQIRAALARRAGADRCCPLTTGIFARLAAESAEEDAAAGRKRITPYWRTIRDDGRLNDKFPGGIKAQAARLRREGFRLTPGKGKQPPRVADFEPRLVKLAGLTPGALDRRG
jgi:alkylated DNA nucleotide flippase Atl1